MGYAGYFSTTNRLKEKPTDQQAALAKISEENSFLILEKLTYNVVVDPKEAKYRRIKLQNPKIKACIADSEGAMEFLALIGWEKEEHAEDGAVLVLAANKSLKMEAVRDIQGAQRDLELKRRDMKRSASVASLKAEAEKKKEAGVAA